MTLLEFDSLTNGRSLCDAHGNIGPTEFCAVMLRELRFYMQSRLTEQGFSEHRTPEDTEFTTLAAIKMILTEQFSLAHRVQGLLERSEPVAVSAVSAAASNKLQHFDSLQDTSAGGVFPWVAPPPPAADQEQREDAGVQANSEATLLAVLRGQEEILRLVRQAGSREAQTALAIRRIQETIQAMQGVQNSRSTSENAQSDTSADDAPVTCSDYAATCKHGSVIDARPRNASPITVPTVPNTHDRFAANHTPLLEPVSATPRDNGELHRRELPAVLDSNHFPDNGMVQHCVSMFSARRTINKESERSRGKDIMTLGKAVGQAVTLPVIPHAVETSRSAPCHPTESTDGAEVSCKEDRLSDSLPSLAAAKIAEHKVPPDDNASSADLSCPVISPGRSEQGNLENPSASMPDTCTSVESENFCGQSYSELT